MPPQTKTKTKTKRSSSSSLLLLNDDDDDDDDDDARVCKKTQRERKRERERGDECWGNRCFVCLFLETSTTPHAARKAKLMDEQNAKDAAVRFFITFFGVFSSSQMLGKLCPSLLHEKHTAFGTSRDGPRVVVSYGSVI